MDGRIIEDAYNGYDLFPSGLPADIWYEIMIRMFVPDVTANRGIYRLQQVCRILQEIGKKYVMNIPPLLIKEINDTEYISAEMVFGNHMPVYSGLVIHFEWTNDQNLSIALWRAIGGVVASNIISSTINMHYHTARVPVITTLVGVRAIGHAAAASFAFTTNNEGGFTVITMRTSEAISVSHDLNPITKYVEVSSHSDLICSHLELLDERPMSVKLYGLFCSIMNARDITAINSCTISAAHSRAFDALGMTTLEDFRSMITIICDISAENNVLPAHAFIALLRDKPWILQYTGDNL